MNSCSVRSCTPRAGVGQRLPDCAVAAATTAGGRPFLSQHPGRLVGKTSVGTCSSLSCGAAMTFACLFSASPLWSLRLPDSLTLRRCDALQGPRVLTAAAGCEHQSLFARAASTPAPMPCYPSAKKTLASPLPPLDFPSFPRVGTTPRYLPSFNIHPDQRSLPLRLSRSSS